MSKFSPFTNFLKKILDLTPERQEYAEAYYEELNRQSRILHIPGSILGIFCWLGFAFDTDPKLHPEFPELFYFRMGLSLFSASFLLIIYISHLFRLNLRGKGLGWSYAYIAYLLNATAFFTGRIADDPAYVSGFQMVIMILPFMPFPRRAVFIYYPISIFIFLVSVLIYRPNLSTVSAAYSMQNLVLSYVLGLFSGYIIERFRFNSFLSHQKILLKNKEVSESMDEIRALKNKQDGDYFLTTLLFNPLIAKETESSMVRIEYVLNQHKKFFFREKEYSLGGDYLSVYNLILQGKKYKAFINGDAMGKSIQGAGGAIVLGAVYNSIIIRSKMDPNSSNRSPERWLKDCFMDLQKVFETFDGGMLVSAVLGLLDETSGTLYYINLEHPWMVLYRDGKASFIKSESHFYKLGVSGIQSELSISTFRMKQGDKIFCGSDGKDDIIIEELANGKRVINEDETEFLHRLEMAEGDTLKVESELRSFGLFSDDFSLISLEFVGENSPRPNKNFSAAREALIAKQYDDALRLLTEYQTPLAASSNEYKLFSRIHEKRDDLFSAIDYAGMALEADPSDTDWLFHTSLLFKRMYSLQKSAAYLSESQELSERVRLRNPQNIKNLIHLADIYRLQGNKERASYLIAKVNRISPNDLMAEALAKKLV